MTLEPKPGGFIVRLRFGRDANGQPARARFLIATKDESVAADIEIRMTAAAYSLAQLRHPKARELLTEMGRVAGDAKAFRSLERDVVARLVAESATAPAPVSVAPVTFRDVAELWTSGKLTELYPDSKLLPEKEKKGRSDDKTAVAVFFPALGNKPMAAITLGDLDEARKAIPRDLHPNTRRGHLVRLRLLFRIAAGPLRLISVVPPIDIPKRIPSNLFGYLYPQEEALLLGCIRVPLLYRVLYGYLARNGCRITETLQLTWDHVDLETGDIRIDKRWTKTRRARLWVLDSDVVEALEAWFIESGRPEGTARVFAGRQKARLSSATVRKRLVGDLRAAGVTRKSILDGADGVDPLRVHDLRASFVTLSLRAGKPLKWIMARTGHESLGVMKGYDRLVQDAEEHRLPAWFSHMSRTIPEFARHSKAGPGVGLAHKMRGEMPSHARAGWTRAPEQPEQIPGENATSVTSETLPPPTSGPAGIQGVGQIAESGPPQDSPVERALAAGLTAALAAEQWELAQTIVQELGERRRARTAPAVTSISDARKRREEKP